jgi:FkbM family methyltransferase
VSRTLPDSAKAAVKRVLRAFGLQLTRYRSPPTDPLAVLLRRYGVDCVLDVGANIGQSGQYFRAIGYTGKLVSFEPVSFLFESLATRAASDPAWIVERLALGEAAGQLEINVSGGHAGASSILAMTQNVLANAPDQQVVAREQVVVDTLDAVLHRHYPRGDRAFLKLDVQGYEDLVLQGGLREIARVVGMKIEMSMVENYAGEKLLTSMIPRLYELGFRVTQFENGWSNSRTGELYQVDAVLFRTSAVPEPPHG